MATKPGLRDRKKDNTRKLILNSARSLFRQKGYAATTLEEIASSAGVHKQTVLRYFKTKDGIALAFRQLGLEQFRHGLLDPARTQTVLEYWRAFIEMAAGEVSRRGDMIRYTRLVEAEPDLLAASLAINMQYEELLAGALSRESGTDPDTDIYSRLYAGFLVAGNFSIARYLLAGDRLSDYRDLALQVIDFAVHEFPDRSAFERINPPPQARQAAD